MLRDAEMKRILVKLFKKQKKRPPPIQLSRDGSWEPVGSFFEEYRPAAQVEERAM